MPEKKRNEKKPTNTHAHTIQEKEYEVVIYALRRN